MNHVQVVTASLAFHGLAKHKNQCWIVPAGWGKSVIHAEITFLLLRESSVIVYVIFQNEALKRVDE